MLKTSIQLETAHLYDRESIETTDVICIDFATQTTCLVKYANKKTFKKTKKKTQELIKKERQIQNFTYITQSILVQLPCSFQEPWNVIVRLSEQ